MHCDITRAAPFRIEYVYMHVPWLRCPEDLEGTMAQGYLRIGDSSNVSNRGINTAFRFNDCNDDMCAAQHSNHIYLFLVSSLKEFIFFLLTCPKSWLFGPVDALAL